MELQVISKNVALAPAAQDHIKRKIDKLGRRLSKITGAKLEVAEEKAKATSQRFVAQLTIESGGTLLRSENRGDNLLEAIDRSTTTMERQIERYKGKRQERRRGGSAVRGEFSQTAESTPPEVVRVKRFTVRPMLVTAAIDQMELLGHDFFLFFNVESEELNLLYRRRDNSYGLIEPEME